MPVNFRDPAYYFNRELSWLKFNQRVLEEAMDARHPLLERLKFASIFSSNLDEFFMIRVAGLAEQVHARIHEAPADGLSPQETMTRVYAEAKNLVAQQSLLLMTDILPQLRKKGIRIRSYPTLSAGQKEFLKKFFKEKLFPVLTPLAIDPAHPFPKLRNLGLNLLVELKPPGKTGGETLKAVVPVPGLFSRFIQVPGKGDFDFVLIEELIRQHLAMLFPDMKVVASHEFRITRNADLDLSEAEADDLLKLIERELRKRRLGTVNRLELNARMPYGAKDFLRKATGMVDKNVFEIDGLLDAASFMFLCGLDFPELKDPEFTPAIKPEFAQPGSKFAAIRRGDILLYHPYESFQPVVEFIQEASRDTKVLAIKQTLYRTSGKSPIVQALKEAVANGKQVTALIELKARFDEETNIGWAKELEQSGVNVIYGMLGLKTHCKVCLVVRQEKGEIRRYVHLSTGNYNTRTARIYTDLALMTSDAEIGKDVSELFNYLTGYSGQNAWRKIFVAPVNLRENFIKQIKECIRMHKEKSPSSIRMVMNSLVDPEMIRWLYKASSKGVKVELVVRGICCLRPGVKGVSENITVRSIVGRFLEHSRVYVFRYGNEQKTFLGSADLMQRNLNRRVEIAFPVTAPLLQERITRVVEILLRDNRQARMLLPDGNWTRVTPQPGEKPLDAQLTFLSGAWESRKKMDTLAS